jgi:glycosyltransferase involved in cell wall biosynthesis
MDSRLLPLFLVNPYLFHSSTPMPSEPTPKVSVIMPIYNVERFLDRAIVSILDQSFRDFELIIIDDCSKDSSVAIARSYTDDPRVRVIANDCNRGVRFTANQGHRLARAEYIARMDGDDMATLDRLELQVKFLDAHPDAAVVGGQHIKIDTNDMVVEKYVRQMPEDYLSILFYAGYDCPFINPTTMYRKSIVWEQLGGMNENKTFAEDYELWLHLLSNGFTAYNLPHVLVKYRINPHSMMNSARQGVRAAATIPMQLDYLDSLIANGDSEKEILCNFFQTPCVGSTCAVSLKQALRSLTYLQHQYIKLYLNGRMTTNFQMLVAREKAYLGYCLLLHDRLFGIRQIIQALQLYPRLWQELPLKKILFLSILGRGGLKLWRSTKTKAAVS